MTSFPFIKIMCGSDQWYCDNLTSAEKAMSALEIFVKVKAEKDYSRLFILVIQSSVVGTGRRGGGNFLLISSRFGLFPVIFSVASTGSFGLMLFWHESIPPDFIWTPRENILLRKTTKINFQHVTGISTSWIIVWKNWSFLNFKQI